MLNRARLARLYRKTGNVGKAEGVEAHLLKLLALADPDFPLLQERSRPIELIRAFSPRRPYHRPSRLP
jgi:hypothetical protein